jgi:hypothetical protein
MKMRSMVIALIAVLLTSLVSPIADAAAAPKIKKYSVTMTKAHFPVGHYNGYRTI